MPIRRLMHKETYCDRAVFARSMTAIFIKSNWVLMPPAAILIELAPMEQLIRIHTVDPGDHRNRLACREALTDHRHFLFYRPPPPALGTRRYIHHFLIGVSQKHSRRPTRHRKWETVFGLSGGRSPTPAAVVR